MFLHVHSVCFRNFFFFIELIRLNRIDKIYSESMEIPRAFQYLEFVC